MSRFSPPPPPPDGTRYRPSDDLRPDDEKLIQFYIDKESKEVWIYLPRPVKMSAVCNEMLPKNNKGLYWDAVELHVKVVDQIRMNDQDTVLQEIRKATTSGLKEGIRYVDDLIHRPSFNGLDAANYLSKLWRWKAALSHSEIVKVYLGYSPYCHSSSDWRTEPAQKGTFYFKVNSNVHFICDSSGLVAVRAESDDIQERLVIIGEVETLA